MKTPTKPTSCCFSGHRPEKLPWKEDEENTAAVALKEKLYDVVEALYQSGITHFISGMARGADSYFCEIVLQLRQTHPEVTLEAAIPYEEQAARWPDSDRNRYFQLLSQCDLQTMLQTQYSSDCMKKRNYYMVDRSAVLIAVYSGQLGGTMQTVSYAKRKGLEVIHLLP